MTNLELITSALRKAGVISETETPSAEQGSQGLTTLNNMLDHWELDEIFIGWYPQTLLDDDFPLDSIYDKAVTYNLAVELGVDNQVSLEPAVLQMASSTKDSIDRRAFTPDEVSQEHLPGGSSIYDITSE